MFKKTAFVLSTLAALVFLSGCAHYQLGSGNEALPYHSISFAPVINNSFAPQIDTLISDALFRNFARGGGMAVESQDNAEVTLQVTIEDFEKLIGATSSTDTGRARSLVMIMRAKAELIDPQGVALHTELFEVRHETYADSGMAYAESQAMPQLADALAKKIYSRVVSNW